MNIVTQLQQHRKLLTLALPMIFSNITTPLLGLVDTAVIGHLDHAYYLGGIAVGSMVSSIMFWLTGFLRMSTTGVVSQALGQNNATLAWSYVFHSLGLALTISLVLLLTQSPLSNLAFGLIGASEQVTTFAQVYFDIRIFSTPAVLANLVILGYLVASRQIKWLVYQLLCINIINIVLDIIFVVYLDWGVSGAASASVIADYCGLVLVAAVVYPAIKSQNIGQLVHFNYAILQRLFRLNRDIFIRSLALQLCLAFITATGAGFGDVYVAANAILLNLFMLASYGLDGFAYAAESLVGFAKGQRDQHKLHQTVCQSAGWCAVVGLSFAIALWLWGSTWIGWLTDIAEVRDLAVQYLPWLIAVSCVAWLSFIMDGVYVGLTLSHVMRNSMLVACAVFFSLWYVAADWHIDGLWLGFCGFMLVRGLTLTGHYMFSYRQTKL